MSNIPPDPNRGHISTKTYMHEAGLSCCFRQWRANSHCRYLHGYPLKVKFTFGASELDDNNWVVDFGSLKPLKAYLEDMFDHTCLVAADDPQLAFLQEADRRGLLCIRVLPAVGCEAVSVLILEHPEQWLVDVGYSPRCFLISVEVAEHGGNSAVCFNKRHFQPL